MTGYLVRRGLSSIVALLGVLVIVFWLARMTGSPASLHLPDSASVEMVDAFNRVHGLDQPLLVQFWNFIQSAARLDFGQSLAFREPAMSTVLRYYPATIWLCLYAILLALVVAIPMGCIAAVRRFERPDRMITVFSLVCTATPAFWLALMAILVFSVWLGLVPTSGAGSWRAWILPVAILSLKPMGVLIQVVRGAMADTLDSGYMTACRARGLSPRRRVLVHGLRNASLPIITLTGEMLRNILNGALILGTVFAFPSIGYLLIRAVMTRDFPVIQAGVFITGVGIVVLSLVVDVIYAFADARVRVTEA